MSPDGKPLTETALVSANFTHEQRRTLRQRKAA